jgi:hypothetical protein
MNEDQMKVLKMIEAGTITAEEGYKLMEAISSPAKKSSETRSKREAKSIRVVVSDEHDEKQVNVRLPIGLFKAGIKIGEKFSPELQASMQEINYDEVKRAFEAGESGEVTTVETNDGHTIHIYIE